MRNLNWDYLDKREDMLAVIEGKLDSSGAFTRDKLFVRSLERLPWHYVVCLWGIEAIKELYTEDIADIREITLNESYIDKIVYDMISLSQ